MNVFNRTEPTKGFLVEVDTGERLVFQRNPGQLDITKNPIYATITIPGLSHPKYQFVNGGEKEISFVLSFYGIEERKEEIAEKADWLESMTYPTHDDNFVFQKEPSLLLFNFGELYKNFTCILTGFKVTYKDLFEPETLYPIRADFSITLKQYITVSIPAAMVKRNGIMTANRPSYVAVGYGKGVIV